MTVFGSLASRVFSRLKHGGVLQDSSGEIQGLRYRRVLSSLRKIELFDVEQFSSLVPHLAGRIKSRINSMLEKRRNPDLPLPPPGGSPLPYGRRRDDAETAHFKKWVALADAALDVNQPNNGGLKGSRTFSRSNVTKVFEIFFGPKRRRWIPKPASKKDEVLI